jgi:hypothetical protein
VGGDLDLNGTQITSLPPDNLTVGGDLDLNGTQIESAKYKKLNANHMFEWKYGKYIKADGLFREVIKRRGNIWYVKSVNKSDSHYLIRDDNGVLAHGKTLREARESLVYKISNTDKSEFEAMTLDSEVDFETAVKCYRAITGACEYGTRDFVDNRMPKCEWPIRIRDIIRITDGEYERNRFKDFFWRMNNHVQKDW